MAFFSKDAKKNIIMTQEDKQDFENKKKLLIW